MQSQTFVRLLETAKETFISAFVNAPGAPIQKVINGLSEFVKGGGLSKAVDMIRNVGGIIGNFVADAVTNPTRICN